MTPRIYPLLFGIFIAVPQVAAACTVTPISIEVLAPNIPNMEMQQCSGGNTQISGNSLTGLRGFRQTDGRIWLPAVSGTFASIDLRVVPGEACAPRMAGTPGLNTSGTNGGGRGIGDAC
ncbi:hypothetical protein SAMN06273572_10965 [Monaibacterium marinum]|uniref:Uncharacterized protein n=1 Tax=Pontivivens marinum TaxID=1690039 RepID=A0A2C9CVB2_9RHOB|nr:hypothetical protein SAMN06273572_10965 [Monaibacterium marinum]